MDKIEELLTRGVDKIYPSREALDKVLLSGKKLRLYQGFDPTGAQLHIGHMVAFRKHRQWQDLGHEVIFLIGDGTGQAGDPSGKSKTREKFFSQTELRANATSYIQQAKKIVRFDGENPIRVMYNGDWLNKLGLVEILDIAQNFSVQQLLERDMFQERIKANESINLREFLYPLLQGYDSVAMDVDLELGGSDQTFNMLAGRHLMDVMKGKEKFVMTTPLLSDSKGIKIGKSEGNVIGLTDAPNDLFAKIMALGDDSIIPMFTLLTSLDMEQVNEIEQKMSSGANPLQFKKQVAHNIVSQLHSQQDADTAQNNFEKTVQLGQIPDEINTISVNSKNIIDVLVEAGLALSRSDARRLVEQGGVKVNGEKIDTINYELSTPHSVLSVGNRKFVRIV
jgi:tyrosyl-tRNA synthetase